MSVLAHIWVNTRYGTRHRIADIAFHYLCLSYGIAPKVIRGPSHKKARAELTARQACMHGVRAISGAGQAVLAKIFERDRTTIRHGIRMHEKRVGVGNGAN